MSNISPKPQLAVSNYDRTNALLVTTIVIGSAIVAILLIAWLTPKEIVNFNPRPIDLASETTEVVLEQNWVEPADSAQSHDTEHAIFAVTDIVSSISAGEKASQMDWSSNAVNMVGFKGRTPGPGQPDPTLKIIPTPVRWKVTYAHNDFTSYSKMLEALDIEIGVVRLHENEIIRLASVDGQFESRASSRSDEATSFYFQNANSIAQRWDQIIAENLEIDLAESTCVHFYSPLTHARLLLLEQSQVELDGKSLSNVRQTRFAIVASDSSPNGFELTIAEISYVK